MSELKKEKIFGIGLSRTGTKSLAAAMEKLGYKVKHSARFIDEVRFYDFLSDIIISARYKFLDYAFPESKFILTVRETESWIKSNQQHATRHGRRNRRDVRRIPLRRAENRFLIFGITYFDEQIFREVQKTFHEEVNSYFRNKYTDYFNKLITLNICEGEGWEKLCTFLDKPIPKIPFPYKNKKKIVEKYV